MMKKIHVSATAHAHSKEDELLPYKRVKLDTASWVLLVLWGGGGGLNMSCSRTQHGDPSGARTPDLWIRCPRC